ncbi:MAG: hypothetical protein CVU38_08690 [Chloroflexi bacterium HGW-Chloroflexi-1]|nr:MAG: hypothetical protein CVU38_08690 [Chloroflexi bacterium HGW-Chloroflexi-1]
MAQNKPEQPDYDFYGTIARPVLENYLSRSITMNCFLSGVGCIEDNMRMIRAIGAKFVGRAVCQVAAEKCFPAILIAASTLGARVHALDPQIVLHAGIFEEVTNEVDFVPIPAHAFEAFAIKPETRNYRYRDMLFPDGSYVDLWHAGASVPDITRRETQMWFYHQACSYIDAGIEAIHFGQVQLMGRDDPQLRTWFSLLERVRHYASRHARRDMVLCDAHVSSGIGCYGLEPIPADQPLGYHLDGRLLFDFHALPLRIKEIPGKPYQAELAVGHLDAIYRRSMGGITPSGWACDHLPYLVDVDYWGATGTGGESVAGKIENLQGIDSRFWVWGWDEICWFANQPEEQRNEWLWYAWEWIRETDPNGFMEMPGQQRMSDPRGYYHANTPSEDCPYGYGQEETLAAIWRSDRR